MQQAVRDTFALLCIALDTPATTEGDKGSPLHHGVLPPDLSPLLNQYSGTLVAGKDDSGTHLVARFPTATDAVNAALTITRISQASPGSADLPGTRLAIHVCAATDLDGVKASVEHCVRVGTLASGGQILLSASADARIADILPDGVSLLPLNSTEPGPNGHAVQVFQLVSGSVLGPFTAPPEQPPAGHLPMQLTTFIGHEEGLAQVVEHLASTRLLTLTGPGGCGKTRLAIEMTRRAAANYPDGVRFLDLVSLSAPPQILSTLARTLGIRETVSTSLLSGLIEVLADKRMLLVFDNCEQMVATCAEVVIRLLQACPRLQIVVTSREALNVPGESVWPVRPLTIPPNTRPTSVEALLHHESIRLFMDRATAAEPRFALTMANAPAVAEICRRLDGIPLAIELAATRVKFLSPEQITRRLDDCFRLLTSGMRTALPRQQTLQATIDWSYNLLSQSERTLWNRLAVFAGGFTLEATEQVCAGNGIESDEVLALLSQLVDRSVVSVAASGDEQRYRLLETIRQYGEARLERSGELGTYQRRHLEWFLDLARRSEAALLGPEHGDWIQRLEREFDNLRAATRWASMHAEQEAGLTLAMSLFMFWYHTSRLSEGIEWIYTFLKSEVQIAPALQAQALYIASMLTEPQGNLAEARRLVEQAMARWLELGNRQGVANSLVKLSHFARQQGEHAPARRANQDALAIFQEIGDDLGTANSLVTAGTLASEDGDYVQAKAFWQEGLRSMRRQGRKTGVAVILNNLGYIATKEGNTAEAFRLLQQSLALSREVGDRWRIANTSDSLATLADNMGDHAQVLEIQCQVLEIRISLDDREGIVRSLRMLAAALAGLERYDGAARLLGAAEGVSEEWQTGAAAGDDGTQDPVATVRAGLGRAAFALAWSQGRNMTPEQALQDLRTQSASRPVPTPPAAVQPTAPTNVTTGRPVTPEVRLTPREIEVCALVAHGYADREIAQRLCISPRTVNRHLENIFNKLDISSRSKLTAWVFQHGLATRETSAAEG